MCELCSKVDIIKDLFMGYFTDEEIAQLNSNAGLEGFNLAGARISLAIMAVVELCLDGGLTPAEIHDGLHVAIIRDLLRRKVMEDNPNSVHSIRDRIRGWES